MEKAARKAAPKLRRDFGEVANLQVSRKGPADFVSQADRTAEAILREQLGQARPDYGFVLEEAGEIAGKPGVPRFIVDPLDGTSNFLHGIPHFAISIAVEEAGQIIAGLVHQPLTDESFWAERGRGAWLQDKRLRVSSRRDLADCLIATGIPWLGHGDHEEWRATYDAVAPQVAGIRRFGSAALDLAWVAAGRFDGFWERGLKSWDMAAGVLLVREAGGYATDWRGQDKPIERGEVVAAADGIHSKLHRLVAGAVRAG